MKYYSHAAIIILLLAGSLSGCGTNHTDSAPAGQYAAEQDVTADAAVENPQEAVQNTQENSEESEAGAEAGTEEELETKTKAEPETSETPTEETDDPYYFDPISYDLSELPAMKNTYYAEWDDNIYFRKYSDEDMEDGALWASFGEIADSE